MNDSVDSELIGNLDKKCNVFCCGRKAGTKNPLPLIKLNYWLFKIKPDIIHVHGGGLGKVSLYPSPKVFTIHNAHSEPLSIKNIRHCILYLKQCRNILEDKDLSRLL